MAAMKLVEKNPTRSRPTLLCPLICAKLKFDDGLKN